MTNKDTVFIDSPIGSREIDFKGSPIGVIHMDVNKSYSGVGNLLQEVINENSQEAWDQIKQKIDYTYENLDLALAPIDRETGFIKEMKLRVAKGVKLLFKPNLVNPGNIDPQTHGPDMGSTTCTEWPFLAAVMRWFHDRAGISYYQMSVGEAATVMTALAGNYSLINPEGKIITPEAVIEGRSGDFYGGWGFYFVRKYLAESVDSSATDDPIKGYEESISGTYIPPGRALDRLMLYDLNRIYDDPKKGRECVIPDGENYQAITLHKAIVGGDPDDPNDRNDYPGCILINVPKFKVHNIALFTNVIKNLGIGLYPMQYASQGDHQWDYSLPQGTNIPGMKGGIPHQVWVPKTFDRFGLPNRDGAGNYMVEKTGGIPATMIDIIKAVTNQGIFMMHLVDGIEAINVDHQGMRMGVKVPEGMVFAGLDPVATDLLCARYMFSNVSLEKAIETGLEDGHGGLFPQEVPLAEVEGKNIISKKGFDCPLSRDECFQRAEKRGLGIRKYYVIGQDAVTGSSIISLQGHLGLQDNDNRFRDLITDTLFYDAYKIPWDLQKTALSYMEAVDKLEGSTLKNDFLTSFDENGDGIVSYEEFGKKGITSVFLHSSGEMVSEIGKEKLGHLKGNFRSVTRMYKLSDPGLNTDGHDIMKEFFLSTACNAAYQISKMDMEFPDLFMPGLVCGKGKWPSLQLAKFYQLGSMLYGMGFPFTAAAPGLFATVLFYADLTQNGGQYAGKIRSRPDPETPAKYISDVMEGRRDPLDFKLYVPQGFEKLSGNEVPNVESTGDPALVLTASFLNGKEVWAD